MSFGLYEIDLETGELWKAGFRVKLQSQPFKVLAMLLERPGHIVTREELQERLWGKDTVVDFDHSLGTAINKIREALGDSAENPRFIETLARRGYRFIAPVGLVDAPHELKPLPKGQKLGSFAASTTQHPGASNRSSAAQTVETEQTVPGTSPPLQDNPTVVENAGPPASSLWRRHHTLWAVSAFAVLTAAAAGFFLGSSRSATLPPHITQLTHNGHVAPSVDSMENLAAVATDGIYLYAATINDGQSLISAISLSGGAVVPLNVPAEVAAPTLGDISPDGSRLLLRDHLSPESEQPLWVVPTLGGSALRVGNVLAHDATWMPAATAATKTAGDGDAILFASGNDLFVTRLNGNGPTHFASLPGRAYWMRWEPNGKLLRFTILDPLSHTLSLWQLTAADRSPVRILAGFSQPASECCGVWTADGRNFVFQSSHGGNADLWRLRGESVTRPVRLTDGPLQFQSPVASRSGNRIFFLGTDARSELETVSAAGLLEPVKGFLESAVRVQYTRDGKWVAWTDGSGQLWRARADGTEKLQLTPGGINVFLAHWSPDGSRLAIMAREPGNPWQIYLTGINGGDLQPLLKSDVTPQRNSQRNAGDPSWSPDGQSLVFGRVNDQMGKENAERTLHILHLQTGQVETLPGSDGLFSPRWSPDGHYIAALSLDQSKVRLFDVAARSWTTLNVPSGADPVWTSDSKSLFVHASLDPEQPIVRISIPDGHVDTLIRLADSRENDAVDFVFGGLTQDNRPLIRARVFTGNFYSLDLQ
jgi:Tol biopolymer transport system component/DNA-binding winged helix-turn-helix (wHTH) protein